MPSIKRCSQTLLRKLRLYHRLVGSRVYDAYWSIADRRMLNARDIEVQFYRRLLNGFGTGGLIFDIGANYGSKTDVFLRLGARVVAVEPDQSNQDILKEKFLNWRLVKKPVMVVGKAVGDKNSVATMWIDAPGSAKNTLSQKWVETLRNDQDRFGTKLDFAQRREVEMVTLEDLFNLYGEPFFIKIDVEGFEPSVLRGMRRPVPYLSFEVNLPEFLPEGLRCVELLGGVSTDGKFNYAVNCRRGLALDQWLSKQDFLSVLNGCKDKSIDVFWKTVGAPGTVLR